MSYLSSSFVMTSRRDQVIPESHFSVHIPVINIKMPNFLKFKGSATERELEGMLANGLIDSTTSARIVYDNSTIIQNEMPFSKFGHRFYNWKRKKDFAAETERTGGMGPPEGKWTSDC